jgi:transposase
MAVLTKKIISGRPYYYLRECQRVDGKPKIVWQKYLGTVDQIVERLTAPTPMSVSLREFGASRACFNLAQELGIVETIDRFCPKRRADGLSVGEYILIATLNRCIAPRSKKRISSWYAKTILPRLLPAKQEQLVSQRFWENMDRLEVAAIPAIEKEITQRAVEKFGLDLKCLLFDATNFFTFLDTFNSRSKLGQRGKSKEGRTNLRLIGLALLVSSDGDVPLFHHTYAGNQHDSVTFNSISESLISRCKELSKGGCDITLIFDKGNNSDENLEFINDKIHFVGSLVPTHHPELLEVDRNKMRRLDTKQLPQVWSYRTGKEVFGVKRTVLVTYNSALYRAQHKTLTREINKRKRKFQCLKESLQRARKRANGKKPTLKGSTNRMNSILAGRHMKDLFTVKVAGKEGSLALKWKFQEKKWKDLERTLLGKTILFTDRKQWTDEQIVIGYRSQHHVESAFRAMKHPHYLSFRPTYHWTDQKLRVHTFYCVLALMLLTLLRRNLAKAGVQMSIPTIVEKLSDIHESTILYPAKKGSPPFAKTILTELDTQQTAMLKALKIPANRSV